MSIDGTSTRDAIRQVRELFGQISQMLLTADAMMNDARWRPLSSTAIAGGSYTIGGPERWIPYQIFRVYKNANSPLLVPFISVLVDSDDENVERNFAEPLVAAHLYRYDNPADAAKYEYEYGSWYAYLPQRRDDGTVFRVDPRKEWPDDGCLANELACFAWPLVAIKTPDDLQEKIVKPLVLLCGGR